MIKKSDFFQDDINAYNSLLKMSDFLKF